MKKDIHVKIEFQDYLLLIQNKENISQLCASFLHNYCNAQTQEHNDLREVKRKIKDIEKQKKYLIEQLSELIISKQIIESNMEREQREVEEITIRDKNTIDQSDIKRRIA